MIVTEIASSASVKSDDMRMSFQAIVRQVKPLIRKKIHGLTVP